MDISSLASYILAFLTGGAAGFALHVKISKNMKVSQKNITAGGDVAGGDIKKS